GQYFRLSLEPSNEPGGRWTRRGIGAVDRVQPKEAVFVFGNVEPNESTSIDVLVHKRLGHIAPTDTFPQYHVVRTEICEPPSLQSDHATVLAIREPRAICQHELDVIAPCAWWIAASTRQRVIGGRNRDKFDAADPDAFEPGNFHIERSANPNAGLPVEHHLRHGPERFHIKVQ